MSYHKPKYIVLRMTFFLVIVSVLVWGYLVSWRDLERLSISGKMITAVLEDQSELAEKYAKDLGMTRENLEKTEAFLRDARTENLALREKVKLLDEMTTLQREIEALRNENTRVNERLLAAQREAQPVPVPVASDAVDMEFESIDEGRSVLEKLRVKMGSVRDRISFLKKKEHAQRVALQQEIDRRRSMLGNNGYLVRDGQPLPMHLPDEGKLSDDIRIKVEFVK